MLKQTMLNLIFAVSVSAGLMNTAVARIEIMCPNPGDIKVDTSKQEEQLPPSETDGDVYGGDPGTSGKLIAITKNPVDYSDLIWTGGTAFNTLPGNYLGSQVNALKGGTKYSLSCSYELPDVGSTTMATELTSSDPDVVLMAPQIPVANPGATLP